MQAGTLGNLEDNFWYDVTVSKMYFPDGQVPNEKMEKFNSYAKTLTNEAYEKVNEYREKAKANLDKFYILICTPNVSMYNDGKYESGEWFYTYSNMAISNLNTKVYEMPIEMYISEYKDKIIDGYRNNYFVMRGGMYYSIEEPESGDSVTYEKIEEQRIYNYMTNREITKLSEIFNEDVRLSSSAGQVEFLTTVRYIEKYLRPGARILDVGAGTGVYSFYFAEQGYHVDALELADENVRVFREKLEQREKVTIDPDMELQKDLEKVYEESIYPMIAKMYEYLLKEAKSLQ